ncbi:MAG: VWA domain-containing protein [Vicinamibacterales bacterium]|nr:VWA domain-containing protein [Vicinamibacterales bacterium]
MLVLLTALAIVTAQEPDIAVHIVSPTADSYLSGQTRLQAAIVPAPLVSRVTQVRFFANGQQVCNITDTTRLECTWDAGPEIRPHVIRVVAELQGGGRVISSVRTKDLDIAERSSVEVTQITAVVTDRGRFVKGLPQQAFRIVEDGVPQAVSHFTAEGAPLEIVVALDVSGSMADAMVQLKNAVTRFLDRLGPDDQVSLVAFNDAMFTLARRETSREARARAVSRLAPWGGTALYDVIIKAFDLLSRQPGRRVLVIFSDGDDVASHATLGNVEEAVRSSDATLFMVGLGRGVRLQTLKQGIERLADLSGGRSLFVERTDRLDEPFAEIIEELSNQYLIGYESTNTARDGAWREVRVEVPGTSYTVRARQGYRGPTS